jgi:Zn-dependent M28 family amino/carboxypeptidase
MEGRSTGTRGEQKAIAYIKERYKQVGLKPFAGSNRQEFPLLGSKKNSSGSTIKIYHSDNTLPLKDGDSISYWSRSKKEKIDISATPLVFVGYGVEAPEYQWDDFKGADVAGKVLLFLNDDPQVSENGVELFEGERRTYYGRWTYKFEQAARHGAAGALVIHTEESAGYAWTVVNDNGWEERFYLESGDPGAGTALVGWLHESLASDVAVAIGTTLDGLFEMAKRRDFKPVDTGFKVDTQIVSEYRNITTANVVGVLDGSDESLKDQFIVFSAHYDHLGIKMDSENGDMIFNGAWDNASGIAAIIALAEAYNQQRPRRSLLFLACGAEEKGILGSKWFVENPPVQRHQMVANINIDMPQVLGVTRDIATVGGDTNTLGEYLRAAASKAGLKVTGDPRPRAGSFYRSDQVHFAKAGIPALALKPGVGYVRDLGFDPLEYRKTHYHQLSDEINEHWDPAGLERDIRIIFHTVWEAANADDIPRWNPGNESEEEWKKLHNR